MSLPFAKLRFLLFCGIVLGVPAAFMAAGDPALTDLGKLALILGPALAGTVLCLSSSAARTGQRFRAWPGAVAVQAALVTSSIAGLALALALLLGAAAFSGSSLAPDRVAVAIAFAALTSVLEEFGWARGGLVLAIDALGRTAGVCVLGVVWGAWHLIPTLLRSGLFPELEAAPPAMLVTLLVTCVLYRELLTRFAERSDSWLAAAAAHALPNMLFAALMGGGLVVLTNPAMWPAYPAPGGLGFAVLVLVALFVVRVSLPRRTYP